MKNRQTFVAFVQHRLVGRGSIEDIVLGLHPLSSSAEAGLRLFDESTGHTVDIDWRGNAGEVIARAKAQLGGNARGRPKLGVESREITLLPRQWTWLDAQGRSASATLRYLVDQAMGHADQSRSGIDALYRQMSALGGDLPGFEEAARRLYAFDWNNTERILGAWPGDLSNYFVERLRTVAGRGKEPA